MATTCYQPSLPLPDGIHNLYPGDVVLLDRFSTEQWKCGYGWFSFDGNRKINGWYLQSQIDPSRVKPVQETDLHDIYFIER